MLIAIALGTTAALGWSINNVLAASALRSVKATTGAFVSLLASLLFTLPIGLIMDLDGFGQLSIVVIGWLVALGFFNFPGGRYCTYAAIHRLGPTRAIMIRNLTPVMAVLLAIAVFGEWPSPQVAIGGLLIVAGLYLAIEDAPRGGQAQQAATPRAAGDRTLLVGYIFAFLAAISYAIATVLIRGLGSMTSQWVGVVVSLVFGTLFIAIIDARTFDTSIVRKPRPFWLLVAAGVASGIAVFCSFTAYRFAPVPVVAPFVNLQPILTALIAHVWLGGIERLTRKLALSLVVATVGAILIATGA